MVQIPLVLFLLCILEYWNFFLAMFPEKIRTSSNLLQEAAFEEIKDAFITWMACNGFTAK